MVRSAKLGRLGAGLGAVVVLFFSAAAACAADGYVRVNQVGYEAGLTMRAYLMALGSETGATYRVQDANGRIVFAAPVGSSIGQWGDFNVYTLDFQLRKKGTYTVSVTGPIPATSPSFPVNTPRKLYLTALQNALYFFQNERDGADFVPTPLRTAPAHLHDETAKVYLTPVIDRNDILVGDLQPTGATIDASGGWWDAGDYLKFVQTASYTSALMTIGVRDFPRQMGARSSGADFTEETRFGLEWLLRMWDDDSQTLYYQVGIGTGNDEIVSDHDLWRLPQVDDAYGDSVPAYRYIRHRPVLLAGPAGSLVSPNLAGRLAAAFAGGYQIFQQSDPDFAFLCILAAEHLIDLADANARQLLTTAPFDFYPETEWRDDLELGATEVYLALAVTPPGYSLPHNDPSYYLGIATDAARAYLDESRGAGDTLNLYDVSGLSHFELYRALKFAGNPTGLAVTQDDLLDNLKAQLDATIGQSTSDPFGFGFPWNDYDSATHGAGLSVMAREVAYLTGDSSLENYSRRWLGNILGANGWGSSFIVGDGSTFPDCMQHQVANLVGSLDGTEPLLRGALVEGPNSFAARGFLEGMRRCPPGSGDVFAQFNANGAIYQDNVQSYSTVEPAIDLTAPSLLMFAWRAAGKPAPSLGF